MSPSHAKSRTRSRSRTGSSAGAGSPNRNLAPADKLKREIQAVLTVDLRSDEHRLGRSKSHWWLLDSEDRVIDLTVGSRETSDFPYHRGRRRTFRYTATGISRRAQTVVERVRAARA